MAACVAEAGFRTLLVDLDPQCNATVALGLTRDLEPNTYTCLLGESEVAQAVRPTAIANLSLVASTPHLAGATVELPRLPTVARPSDGERAGGRGTRDRARAGRVLRARGPGSVPRHAGADPA